LTEIKYLLVYILGLSIVSGITRRLKKWLELSTSYIVRNIYVIVIIDFREN